MNFEFWILNLKFWILKFEILIGFCAKYHALSSTVFNKQQNFFSLHLIIIVVWSLRDVTISLKWKLVEYLFYTISSKFESIAMVCHFWGIRPVMLRIINCWWKIFLYIQVLLLLMYTYMHFPQVWYLYLRSCTLQN